MFLFYWSLTVNRFSTTQKHICKVSAIEKFPPPHKESTLLQTNKNLRPIPRLHNVLRQVAKCRVSKQNKMLNQIQQDIVCTLSLSSSVLLSLFHTDRQTHTHTQTIALIFPTAFVNVFFNKPTTARSSRGSPIKQINF